MRAPSQSLRIAPPSAMEGEKSAERKVLEDPRFEFLANYTLRTMRLKPEKWTKMASNEDNFLLIVEFLNNPQEKVLIICFNAILQLVPFVGFPAPIKSKAVYFAKRLKIKATVENVRMVLACGDLAPKPAEQLEVLMDSV
jgi:dynein heavy chain, axonemal